MNESFWAILTDPAHMMAELVSSAVWDLVVITLLYQLLWKRWIAPKWTARIHKEIDTEHGVIHNEVSVDR